MTDILDRPDSLGAEPGILTEPATEPRRDTPPAPEPATATADFVCSPMVRNGLAAASIAAGAIHLTVAPSHIGDAPILGWGFLVAGWLQIGLGVLALLRSGRAACWSILVANAALVSVWVLSRTVGLPIEGAKGAMAVGFVDAACVALELAAIVLAFSVLAQNTSERSSTWARWLVPAAVFALATAALLSPSALRSQPADTSLTAAAPPTTVHDHGAPPSTAAATPAGAAPAAPAAEGGHTHAPDTYVPLDPATQKTFAQQMAETREITMRYPTVADAEAAGLRPVGKYSAGSGAHYLAPNPVARLNFDTKNPIIWLFAGNNPTSPVVGVMYFSFAQQQPEGYAGPNDHWHQHQGLCLTYGPEGVGLPLPIDRDATAEQCKAVNGQFMDRTGWMIHVWSAPGWESPQGVFSHDNPLLVCSDGRTTVELNVGCDSAN